MLSFTRNILQIILYCLSNGGETITRIAETAQLLSNDLMDGKIFFDFILYLL